MIEDPHALDLYMMGVSAIEAKGTIVTIGLTTLREYRFGSLIIHYIPSTGHLDVWSRRKVFSVTRFQNGLRVVHYAPGEWEDELEAAAAPSRSGTVRKEVKLWRS